MQCYLNAPFHSPSIDVKEANERVLETIGHVNYNWLDPDKKILNTWYSPSLMRIDRIQNRDKCLTTRRQQRRQISQQRLFYLHNNESHQSVFFNVVGVRQLLVFVGVWLKTHWLSL